MTGEVGVVAVAEGAVSEVCCPKTAPSCGPQVYGTSQLWTHRIDLELEASEQVVKEKTSFASIHFHIA